MPRRVLSIRDPVHGYIAVTAIERALLDHPATQRLRWVAQSGLAQLVFPEVRTSRFTHSLGAMHLASQFLRGVLANASDEAGVVVADGFRAIVERADEDVTLGKETVETLQGQGLMAGTAVGPDVAPLALVIEQGLRLAALFHDLGHLPFSHDFEYVLRALAKDEVPEDERFERLRVGKPPHEQIGYSMARLLQREVYDALTEDAELRPIVSLSFKVARSILRASPARALAAGDAADAALGLLHTLIDGEIDVDRSDYLLRDARAYGFDYVSFDLKHLVANLSAHSEDGGLELVVRAQGQAAAESFLFSRYRMYQWGVFHHKVVQVGAALQARTRSVLTGAFANEAHPLHCFVTELATLANEGEAESLRREALASFALHDDPWWMLALRAHRPTDPWHDLIVYRTPGPVSLWKRASAFPLSGEELRELNHRLPGQGETDRDAAYDDIVGRLREQHGVLLTRVKFTPLRRTREGTSELRVQTGDATVKPLSELSTMIDALSASWSSDLQVFASAPSSHDAETLPETVATSILEALPGR